MNEQVAVLFFLKSIESINWLFFSLGFSKFSFFLLEYGIIFFQKNQNKANQKENALRGSHHKYPPDLGLAMP